MTDRQPAKIGLVGGLSWASSVAYYQRICEETLRRTQNGSCGQLLIESLDSCVTEALLDRADWAGLAELVHASVERLRASGCRVLAIASNTVHVALDKAYDRPPDWVAELVRIDRATERRLDAIAARRVGVLGTSTSTGSKYLQPRTGAATREVVFADAETCEKIDRIIFEELCRGVVSDESRSFLRDVIARLVRENELDTVVLGCTELGLAVRDCEIAGAAIVDTLDCHVSAIVSASLAG